MNTLVYKKILLLSAISICLFIVSISKISLVQFESHIPDPEHVTPFHPEKLVPFMFGFEGFISDIFFVNALIHTQVSIKGIEYERTRQRYNQIVDLDPMFEKAYIIGSTQLSLAHDSIGIQRTHDSVELLEKWMNLYNKNILTWRHIPDYWKIPQTLGFHYALELRDPKKASEYMDCVAAIPESPSLYKSYAATLRKNAYGNQSGLKGLETALAMDVLQTQYQSADDSEQRTQIKNKLVAYSKELIESNSIKRKIEKLNQKIKSEVSYWKEHAPYLGSKMYWLTKEQELLTMGFYPSVKNGDK